MLDVVSFLGFAALVGGVYVEFGEGWALIVAGVTLLTVVSAAVRIRTKMK